MKFLKRWWKRVAIICAVLAVLFLAAGGYTLRKFDQADKQHASFCDCGMSIKKFLGEYAAALQTSSMKQDVSPLAGMFSEDFTSPDRGHWQLSDPQDLGDATLTTMRVSGSETLDRQSVLDELQQYLSGIKKIENIKCKIDLIEIAEPDSHATLTVKYVLDGIDVNDQLFQDRFFFRWSLQKSERAASESGWEIVRDELVEGVRVAGDAKGFYRVDPQAIGIDYVHQRNPNLDKNALDVHLKFAVIEHAAGGVSAADFDGDGLIDLFFADGKRCRLYRNVSSPQSDTVAFADVTDEVGLSDLDQAHSALFVDFDNDGDKDLFVARYMTDSRFYRNENNRFVDQSNSVGLNFVAPSVSACVLDYDRDGFLDLYVGVNGNAFENSPDIPFYATNGEPNRLFRNAAGSTFEDVSESAGIGNTGWTLACTAGDYDNDGYSDIVVANDFGRKVLYRNNHDGTFADVTKQAGVLDFSGGMGVAFCDLNGDAYPDLLTSNIESGQRWFGEEITLWQYMRNACRTKWLWSELDEYRELYGLLGDKWKELGQSVGEGNSVFANNGDGTFVEWDCHANRAGWAWSVNPLDYDNDGDIDIHVANGWITSKLTDDL